VDSNIAKSPAEILLGDIKQMRQRLQKKPLATIADVNLELRNNTYPIFEAIVDQIIELDGVIQEVVENQDNYLQEDTAARILAALATATALAEMIKELLPEFDDLRRKRFEDAIQLFEISAQAAAEEISEAIVNYDDQGDGNDGESQEDSEQENAGQKDDEEGPEGDRGDG
jgi:hypothetical protein